MVNRERKGAGSGACVKVCKRAHATIAERTLSHALRAVALVALPAAGVPSSKDPLVSSMLLANFLCVLQTNAQQLAADR
jgi:hypothetical protein